MISAGFKGTRTGDHCCCQLLGSPHFHCRFSLQKIPKKKQNCRSDQHRCPRHCLEFLPFALPAFEPTAVGINQHLCCVREILSLGQSTDLEKSYNHVYTVYIYTQNNMVTSFGSLYLVIVKLSKHVFRKTWINLDDFTAILSLLLFSGLL